MNNHLLRFDTDKKIQLFDFETYNLCLSFIGNRMWQAGLMLIQGDKAIESKNIYIKWQNCDLKIGVEAAKITKYSQEVFDQNAIDSAAAFDIFYDKVENCDWLLGHNILSFDCYLLRDWYRMMGKPWKHLMNKMIDTNAIARGIKYGITFKSEDSLLEYQYRIIHTKKRGVKSSLSTLAKEFKIDFNYETLHDGLNDCDLNRKVWNVLKNQIEI